MKFGEQLESEKIVKEKEYSMEEAIDKVVEILRSEKHEMVAFSKSGGYIYGCNREDIPQDAIDSYAEIDSQKARNFIEDSLYNGNRYGDINPPKEQE